MSFELKKACPPVLFANASAVRRVDETAPQFGVHLIDVVWLIDAWVFPR